MLRFVAEDISVAEMQAVDEHLAACPECLERVRALDSLRRDYDTARETWTLESLKRHVQRSRNVASPVSGEPTRDRSVPDDRGAAAQGNQIDTGKPRSPPPGRIQPPPQRSTMTWSQLVRGLWERLASQPALAFVTIALACLAIVLVFRPLVTAKPGIVAQLVDSTGMLTVTDDGKLIHSRKVALAQPWPKRVAEMLATGRTETLPELKDPVETVRSGLALLSAPEEPGTRPALISPAATAVRMAFPLFQWNGVAGATNYQLIVAHDGQPFGNIDVDAQTSFIWPAGQSRFQPGEVYTWQIETRVNGTLRLSQPASFFVLPPARLKQLEELERECAGSAALLTAVYQAFGLREEARLEWDILRQLNPTNTAVLRIGAMLTQEGAP